MRHIVSISLSKQTYEVVEKVRFKVSPGKKKTEESSCPDSVLQLFGNMDLTAWEGKQRKRQTDRVQRREKHRVRPEKWNSTAHSRP